MFLTTWFYHSRSFWKTRVGEKCKKVEKGKDKANSQACISRQQIASCPTGYRWAVCSLHRHRSSNSSSSLYLFLEHLLQWNCLWVLYSVRNPEPEPLSEHSVEEKLPFNRKKPGAGLVIRETRGSGGGEGGVITGEAAVYCRRQNFCTSVK